MMIPKEKFREQVHSGRVLFSTMLSLMRNPRWLLVLKEFSFDFITIDTEHSPYSWSELVDLIAVAVGVGLPPVVRIPRPAWHYVTKVFDAGAYGVLAPYCETVEEVKEVVRAARWRPLKGKFVERVMNENIFPDDATKKHLQEFNRGNVVMIGIESMPAVENLKAILDIGGIDAIFVGPADLSTSLGIPRQFDHPQFVKTVRRIIKIARQYGVQVAVNFQPLAQSIKWAQEGMTLVIHSQDFKILSDAYAELLQQLVQATGRRFQKGAEPGIEI